MKIGNKWSRVVSGICGAAMLIVPFSVLANPAQTVVPEMEIETAADGVDLDNGLLAYLNMDENTEDQTGLGSPEQMGSVSYENGVFGKAVRFSNTSSYLKFTNRPSRGDSDSDTDLEIGSGQPFSISFWMKANPNPSAALTDGFIAGTKDWSAAKNYGYSLTTSGSVLQLVPRTASTNRYKYTWPGGISTAAAEWIHVCVSSSNSVNQIYINGAPVEQKQEALKDESGRKGWGDFSIGADYNGKYGIGDSIALDEFRVWNRAVSAKEAETLYHAVKDAVTAVAVQAPDTLAVGTDGVSIQVSALVDKGEYTGLMPLEDVSWSVLEGDADITAEGSGAKAVLHVRAGASGTVKVQAESSGKTGVKVISLTENVIPVSAVIQGADEIIQDRSQDVDSVYTFNMVDENGAAARIADPQNIRWTLNNSNGVVFKGQGAEVTAQSGQRVTLTVPRDIQPANSYTLTAEYQDQRVVFRGYVIPSRELPENLQSKIIGQWTFDGNVSPSIGTLTPTSVNGLSYGAGVSGQAAIFKKGGNHLNFGSQDLTNKTISFAFRPVSRPAQQDPAILANKSWSGDGLPKGFVLAYSYHSDTYPHSSDLKTRIADGSKMQDAWMPFEKGLWQTITIVFDNENGAYRIYKDGAPALTGSSVKDGAINTADFSSGWQNGAYSLILGNDGTGEYGQNANQDYEYWIDNFTILDTAVSAEEAVALSDVNIAVEKDLNSITPALIGSETVAAGGGYNTAVHMTGKKLRNISRETFDLVFDPNVLEYNKEVTETQSLNYDQFKNKIVAIDASEAPQGILHVSRSGGLSDAQLRETKTRLFQACFTAKAVTQDSTSAITLKNLKCYAADGGEQEITAPEEAAFQVTVLAPPQYDLNGDGVVGAGDIALAPAEQKADAAAQSGIYPYKRAFVFTMDGGGNVWDIENAHYFPAKYQVFGDSARGTTPSHYQEEAHKADRDAVRKNPIALRLYNEEFAMSTSAKSEDPPISAQNYCSILHGEEFTKFPSDYKRDNNSAGDYYWQDFGKETAKYPSLFKVINEQTPRRSLFGTADWKTITSGIAEPDSGMYQEWRGGASYTAEKKKNDGSYAGNNWEATDPVTPAVDTISDYFQSAAAKNTAFMYVQTDLMDHYGHQFGYFTDGYYRLLQSMDDFYTQMFDAMKAADLYEDTLFIGNADHGGHFNTNYTLNGVKQFPSGSHSTYSWAQDSNIFIGIGGQTIDSGKKLSGGANHDIPALVLKALRLDKPDSMKNSSSQWADSAFLDQEALAKKGREIEEVTYSRFAGHAEIGVGRPQAGREARVLDAVIRADGATGVAVDPAEGVTVLRSELADGLLKLTLSCETALGASAAKLTFSGAEPAVTAVQEVMLGADSGKELYADLRNVTPQETTIDAGEITVQGDTLSADISITKTAEENGRVMVVLYQNGVAVGTGYQEVGAETGIIKKTVAIQKVDYDSAKAFFWNMEQLKPMAGDLAIPSAK